MKPLRSIGVISIILFLVNCTAYDSVDLMERNKKLVMKMNAEVWNKGNIKAIEDYFSVDFVQHFIPDNSERKGLGPLRQHIIDHRKAFPDWKEEIIHIVAENNLVVIHFKSSGTNLGDWMGKPATGNYININEFSILRIKDGKIVEQWLMPDLFNLMDQLYNEKE